MFTGSSTLIDADQDSLPVETADAMLKQCLLTRVLNAFPDLTISKTRLEHSGGDHLLLIADETHVFRFPRPGQHGLTHEIRVLKQLKLCSHVAVPNYGYVDPDNSFAGYPFIIGEPLTPARFERLPYDAGVTILAGVSDLLRTLHGLDPDAIRNQPDWPRSWTVADFAERALTVRLPVLSAKLPTLAPAIHGFLVALRSVTTSPLTVVHGDLTPEHILIVESSATLAGVIDFGDVALGDPAQDLAGLWAYGEEAARTACTSYADGHEDPSLITRSRQHFIRYRIDRLFEELIDNSDHQAIDRQASELDALLSLPFTN